MTDEFDELMVREEEVLDRALVRDLLKDYLRISTNGEILPEPNFFTLEARQKIIIFLLARKIMKAKEIISEEGCTPTELSTKTGVPIGTVKPAVRELIPNILSSDNGKYWIPNYNLKRLQNELRGKEQKSTRN